MKVNVHAVNFTIDGKLVDFIQERIDKLEKYYDKVVSQCKTFEEAVEQAAESLERMLLKRKEKIKEHI
jgi:putative sigma-54 modulation protein